MGEKFFELPVFRQVLRQLPSLPTLPPYTFGLYPQTLSSLFQKQALPNHTGYVVRHPSSEAVLGLAMKKLAAEKPKNGRPLSEREIQEIRTRRYASGHVYPTAVLAEEYDTSENFIMMCCADKQHENDARIARDRHLRKGKNYDPTGKTRIRVPLHDIEDGQGNVVEKVVVAPATPVITEQQQQQQLSPSPSPSLAAAAETSKNNKSSWRQAQEASQELPQRWENRSNRDRYQFTSRPSIRRNPKAPTTSSSQQQQQQPRQYIFDFTRDDFERTRDFNGAYRDPAFVAAEKKTRQPQRPQNDIYKALKSSQPTTSTEEEVN